MVIFLTVQLLHGTVRSCILEESFLSLFAASYPLSPDLQLLWGLGWSSPHFPLPLADRLKHTWGVHLWPPTFCMEIGVQAGLHCGAELGDMELRVRCERKQVRRASDLLLIAIHG